MNLTNEYKKLIEREDALLSGVTSPEGDHSSVYMSLAKFYFSKDDYASAYLYYQKVTHSSKIQSDIYHSLLMMCCILDTLGNRSKSVKFLATQATVICPDRPEAYYVLSKITYDNCRHSKSFEDWMTVYSNAILGLRYASNGIKSDFYPGSDSLRMLQLLGAYHLGKDISFVLSELSIEDYSDKMAVSLAIQLFNELGLQTTLTRFDRNSDNLRESLMINLDERIEVNYSESMQDIFAWICSEHESFIDVIDRPELSNTILLESLGYKGAYFSMDNLVQHLNLTRSEKAYSLQNPDVIRRVFDKFGNITNFGYLSISIACEIDYILNMIDFSRYTFDCITISHHGRDYNRDHLSKDYILLCKNVTRDYESASDDWYVHKRVLENNPNLMNLKCENTFAKDIIIR